MAPVPILYVHSSAQLYGSDRLLLNMAAGLDCDRFRPVVVLPEDGPLVAALQQAGVAVHRGKLSVLHRTLNPLFWAGFWGHLPLSVANLARLIKAEGVRLVHSNTSHVLDGALAAKAAGVPHVWHIREVHTGLSKLGRPLSRFVYASSERVLCMSTASKEAFFGRRPNDPKLQVVYDGVNPARFELPGNGTALRAGLGLPPQAPLLGMVGRIAHWKGHRLFLQAAAQVRRQFPAARFLIVGDAVTPGDARLKHELQQLTTQLNLNEAVMFTGFREDIPQIMNALDVFVLPSELPEPWGMVVLEAMAAARPVIATRQGGPLEIVDSGKTGFLVPPDDPRPMAEAMAALLQSPRQAAAMGRAGQVRCREHFSADQTRRQIAAMYHSILEQRS